MKLLWIAAVACCAFVAGANAQTAAQDTGYPTKPVRFIVPFAPGGGADIIGRIVAQLLHEALGQPVVVHNRAGAGSSVGTDIAAKAPPDGYTLLLGNISLAFNPALYRKLSYDALTELAPVTLVPARTPRTIVDQLHRRTVKAFAQEDAKRKLEAQGVETITNTPAEFSAYLKSETVKWTGVVRAADITPQ